MPIEPPTSDLSRSTLHEPDRIWPHAVKLGVHWMDADGRVHIKTEEISANQFFGTGGYSAPLSGDFIISLIERMIRTGPPKFKRNANGRKRG